MTAGSERPGNRPETTAAPPAYRRIAWSRSPQRAKRRRPPTIGAGANRSRRQSGPRDLNRHRRPGSPSRSRAGPAKTHKSLASAASFAKDTSPFSNGLWNHYNEFWTGADTGISGGDLGAAKRRAARSARRSAGDAGPHYGRSGSGGRRRFRSGETRRWSFFRPCRHRAGDAGPAGFGMRRFHDILQRLGLHARRFVDGQMIDRRVVGEVDISEQAVEAGAALHIGVFALRNVDQA